MYMTEEEYYQLEADMFISRESYQQRRIREFEELGGTYGIVNIMFNGEFIKFTEAMPEQHNNKVFAPAVPFFEAMGATVSYDGQTRGITAEFADGSMYFIIGQDTLTVEKSGVDRELPIDAAPYIKKNISYIPVRAVAEALDLDVYWDSYFKTVVIIDSKAIITKIDKDFTIVNKVLNMPLNMFSNDGSPYKTIIDMLVSITQINSLDGNTTAKAGANVTFHSDGRSFYLKGAIDLSAVLNMVLDEYSDYDYYVYESEALEDMKSTFDALRNIEVELIFNYDEDMLYIRAPVISTFIPEVPANVWIAVSGINEFIEEAGFDSIIGEISLGGLAGGTSIGELVFLENFYMQYYDPVYLYRELMNSAEIYKVLLSDEKFVKKGNDYTLSLTQDDLYEIAEEYGLYFYYPRFNLNLTISTRGDAVTGVSGAIVYREGYGYYYETQYTCELDISQGHIRFSFEVHEKNEMIVRIDIGAESSRTNTPVPKAPPAGEKVVPFEELFPDNNDRTSWIVPVSN